MGDLGRSPRMLNHARSLSASGAAVTLVGYLETALPADVESDSRILVRPLPSPSRAAPGSGGVTFLMVSARRSLLQVVQLTRALFSGDAPNVLMVQNPPSIPTLAVARLAAWLRRSQLILDWHNFGFAMLAVRLGERHLAVRVARWYERVVARGSGRHLCVSRAMSNWLSDHFSVTGAIVVYDRPIACPGPLPLEERAAVLATIGESAVSSRSFAICPTSWTADEDIELLLRGLIAWDRASATDLTVVITGKGPLRERFEQTLLATSFRRTRVRTCFLPPEGYRQLLRACDFGFSLHRSASGVDLPMKIVDCFGAGLPVLAYHYGPCLEEQVVQGKTGLFFRDEAELVSGIAELATPETRKRFRTEVNQRERASWADEWNRQVRPLLSSGKSESHHAG